MTAYPRCRLGNLCEFKGGGTPSRKVSNYWNGDIPWATVKDFQSDRIESTMEFISETGIRNSATTLVPEGTVLLVTRVGLGKVAIAGVDLAINQDIKALFPSNRLLPAYLFWALKSLASQIESKGSGSTVKGITLSEVKDLIIIVPPLDEQRRIVDILDRTAKFERLRAQARERLREFIPALFIKMFDDPVTNPMGWKTFNFGDLVEEFRYGISKKCHTAETDGDFPILRIPNVLRNVIDWNGIKFAALDDAEANAVQLKDGDILFVRTNGNPEYIGRCAVFHSNNRAAYASYLIRARLTFDSILAPEYIVGTFSTVSMRNVILSLARTTAGNYNINIKSLSRLPIPVPPLDLQYRYTQIVQTARSAVTITESGSRTVSALNASLMPRLLGNVA